MKFPDSLQSHIAPWKSHEPPQQDTSGTECAFCASYRKIRRRKSGRNGLGQSGQWLRARFAFVYETAPTGGFSIAASWWGLRSPYPHIVQNHMILPIGGLLQQVTAGVQMHCRENQILDFGKETPCQERKKVKSIVKTKVISARVTEVVHELLHRQAEDAGMTLSEFTA